jgi:hypothetical protein
MTFTAGTLTYLRRAGYLATVVESCVPQANLRRVEVHREGLAKVVLFAP